MHRVESENATATNLFTDGPPGTRLGASWHNAVQEELAYAIEQAGLTVEQESNDSHQQLKSAIEILSAAYGGVPSGTKVWFYQDTAPTDWTLDAVPADAVLAVKGGANAYNAAGGTQAGTWTQPNHTHGVGSYAFPNHQHAVGTIAFPNHSHSNGTLALAHTHNVGTFAFPNHSHAVGTIAFPNHSHAVGTIAFPNHSHAAGTLAFPNHTHDLDTGSAETTCSFGNWRCFSQNPGAGLQLIAADYTGGTDTGYPVTDITETDGGGSVTGSTANDAGASCTGSTANDAGASCTGSTANDAGAAITGTSAAASTDAVTGSTASDGGASCTGSTASDAGAAITGTSANGATANTYRPLAQLGIICTKD